MLIHAYMRLSRTPMPLSTPDVIEDSVIPHNSSRDLGCHLLTMDTCFLATREAEISAPIKSLKQDVVSTVSAMVTTTGADG